jgi:two-component system, chemotaxis family, chemotaxis protein CheY
MSSRGPAAAASRPRVLLVDDDVNILDFLGLALEDEGYEVETAPNGAAALEQLRRSEEAAGGAPEVIILDLWMPVMDGPAFLRAYRERPGPRAAVIALTAAQYDAAQSAAVEADGFLTKPFSLDELIDLVGRFARAPGAGASV